MAQQSPCASRCSLLSRGMVGIGFRLLCYSRSGRIWSCLGRASASENRGSWSHACSLSRSRKSNCGRLHVHCHLALSCIEVRHAISSRRSRQGLRCQRRPSRSIASTHMLSNSKNSEEENVNSISVGSGGHPNAERVIAMICHHQLWLHSLVP